MADIEEDFLFSIDVGGGETFQPKTAYEIIEFINKEREIWAWILAPDIQNIAPKETASTLSILNQIHSYVEKYRSDKTGQSLQTVAAAMRNSYGTDGKMLYSGSDRGQFVLMLKETHSVRHAFGAFASFTGRPITATPGVREGMILAVMYEEGLHAGELSSAASEYRNLASRYSAQSERALGSLKELEAEWTKRLDEVSASKAALVKNYEKKGKALYRSILEKRKLYAAESARTVSQAVSELKAVEEAFRVQMELRAPVEYWSSKASTHEQRSKKAKWWAIGYGTAATAALLVALTCLSSFALDAAEPIVIDGNVYQKPISVFIILATIGVVASTAAFWAGRIFVRLYLSELHLGMDARERQTMVMTYLALIAERAAEKDDRHIVLSSLFRPTSDGIVKEDAAPETSIASLAARLLDQGGRR